LASGRSEIRPELQALRAVAVVLVVIYHLWPDALSGGFIGVDVFFVLSGFLITSLLVREVDRTGTVSLTHFWARRIRRLLPAAFTVLLASYAITVSWLPRSVWEQTFQEIAAASVYAVNWLLAANSVDYLAADNVPSIVQHYWSLAVEEQFYMVWPVLILVAVGAAGWVVRRRGMAPSAHARVSIASIAIALGVVALGSFVFSILETARSQPSAFFITPTRAWEFAGGGLLAFLPGRLPARMPASAVIPARSLASWLGLLAIGVAAVTFSDTTAFPGYAALLPVVGTMLVIQAGNVPHRWAPTAIAEFGPIQLVGDLSYSIYLWHWPLIILYSHLRGHPPELRGGLLVFATAVVFAWVTKLLIEDPVRRRTFWTSSRRRSYGMAGALMVATISVVGATSFQLHQETQAEAERVMLGIDGKVACFGAAAVAPGAVCPDPFAAPPAAQAAFARGDKGFLVQWACHTRADSAKVLLCPAGDPDGQDAIALIGNSHAGAMASGLDRYAREQGWRLQPFVKLACGGVALEQVADWPPPECVTWTKEVVDRLERDPDVKLVVFQSYAWASPKNFTPEDVEAYQAEMKVTWSRLLATGKQVAVLSDPPGTRPDLAPDCVSKDLADYDPCRRAIDRVPSTNIIYETAKETPGVTVIDMSAYFCDSRFCHAVVGGVVVYFDAHHLTATYATTLARQIGPQLADLVRD
jgi:peptidoglycan/LPS O-acetylase OafA/YrhL